MMYQITIRRKAGITREKIGTPMADHAEAIAAAEALLNERFPNAWRQGKHPDTWIVRNSLGAKLLACDENGLALRAETANVTVSMSQKTRELLGDVAREQGLMNPKHPDSPNISAAIEYLARLQSERDQDHYAIRDG